MKPERAMWLIAGSVALWGVYHAVGAFWNFRLSGQPTHNPWRSVVVLACVAGFLAFWGLMLAQRRRRLRAEEDDSDR